MGYEMGKSLTSRKSAHSFVPGKNRIRKIREKSGSEKPDIFDQILVNVHRNELIYEVQPRFFGNFNKFDVFKIAISPTKRIAILKSVYFCLN